MPWNFCSAVIRIGLCFCWGILLSVLCLAGTSGRMEDTALEAGASLYGFCDLRRIYYRDLCQQMDAVECMGLFGSAASAVRADLSSVYDLVFRTLCAWDLSCRIFALLVIRRRKTTVSCVIKKTCGIVLEVSRLIS